MAKRDDDMASSRKQLLWKFTLVAGMLIFGSINTVSKKMGYNTCSHGLSSVHLSDASSDAHSGCHGDARKFDKPWTQSAVMFAGEAMCLWYFFCKPKKEKVNNKEYMEALANEVGSPALGGNAFTSPTLASSDHLEEDRELNKSDVLVCWLPACCDLGGTTLSGIGLLFTTASVFQMLRGSLVVFTGLFTVCFLKKPLPTYKWVGIAITVVGITLVGLSSYITGSSSSGDKSTTLVMVGNACVVLSQIMSSFQMVVEEKFLKDRKLPPEFVVGCEGSFGLSMMLLVVLPVVYLIPFSDCDADWCKDGNGIHENAIDAFVLMGNNAFLLFLVLLYWVSIAFYNFFGLFVSKELSAVHRTLVDASRTILVWACELVLYYSTDGEYGEKWINGGGSILQLVGFVIMINGVFVYNTVYRLPEALGGRGYPEEHPTYAPVDEQVATDAPWYKNEGPLNRNSTGRLSVPTQLSDELKTEEGH